MISGDLTEGSVPEDQAAIRLVVNESRIIMNPPHEGILKEVCSLTAREFVQRDKPPYDMTSFDVPEELFFRYTNRETGEKEVAILPGLLEEIKQYCQKYGITYHVKTSFVNPLPKPNIGATKGWRFKQKEFFTECITPNRSGIFVATTRYGKSYQMENTIRAWDKDYRFLLVVPGLDNVAQLYDHMKKAFPDRNVRWIGGGKSAVPSSEAKANIIVTSMDSLHLWAGKENDGKYEGRNIDFLLVDEPQDLPTPDRRVKFYHFPRARKYGYTATVEGRFDRRDKWITAIMGPVLGEKTYKEALAEGAVSEIVVVFLRIQMPFPFIWRSRRGAYNGMMFHSPEMAALNARLMTEIVPDDWQTMCFIKEEKQADVLTEALERCDHRVAMAKLLSKKERLAVTKMVRNDEIKRILATNIYVKGVTFHELKCLINMEGGGGNLNTIQKAGRLAEVRAGKKAGVLIDFFFEPSQGLKDEQERLRLRLANFRSNDSVAQPPWAFLYNDSMARYRVYQKRGFTLKFARTEEELKSIIKRYE